MLYTSCMTLLRIDVFSEVVIDLDITLELINRAVVILYLAY